MIKLYRIIKLYKIVWFKEVHKFLSPEFLIRCISLFYFSRKMMIKNSTLLEMFRNFQNFYFTEAT